MHVSAEILTTVITFAGFIVALGAGFGWLIQRSDKQLRYLAERIDAVRDEVASVRSEVASVRSELVEVKVAVARLEGPRTRLIPAR